MAGGIDLSGGQSSASTGGAYGGGGPGYGGGAGYGGGGGGGFGGQMASAAMQDPTIRRQMGDAAYEHAQQGLNVARTSAVTAVEELRKYVQEGPAGMSVLCFLGGLATTLIGFLGLLNVFSSITSPFHYVLNGYLTCFGVVTFLLEADVESMKNMRILGKLGPFVETYQREVFNRAAFLTELRGRGFFYIFVGNLAITQCLFCPLFLVGFWNLLMGVLCMLMSFGINPAAHIDMSQGGPQQHHASQSEPFTQNYP